MIAASNSPEINDGPRTAPAELLDWERRRFNPVSLRRALVLRGLTSDQDVADRIGIAKATVQTIKAGKPARPKSLSAMLKLLADIDPLVIDA